MYGENERIVTLDYNMLKIWAHTLKVAILTSYKKLSVGCSELNFHIYALGTSYTYFTQVKMDIIGPL